MRLRQVEGDDLVAGVAAALAGEGPVAPMCEPRLTASLRPDLPVTEPDAALVVPTSGTTGEPKAVVLSASAIRFSAEATHARLGGPGDWVCALPTQHVAGLMTIARAVVGGGQVRFARTDLADLPVVGGRSYLSVVSAQLDRALSQPQIARRLAGFAAVLVGGSAVPQPLVDRARAAGIAVVVTYGASETCGGCVYDGRPLDGVRVELADQRIGLGGPMAFLGYRGRPDLTAEVLDGDLVRTNDRGTMVDGRLTVLGRLDDVVISGGENVDLAAAQKVCDEEFSAVDDPTVVLLAVPDQRWGVRIVAVATGGLTLAQLQQRLDQRLSRAAIPKELRLVDQMAYTSIGKIDRAWLRRTWNQKGEYGDIG